MIIDENMTSCHHTEYISKKLSKNIGILLRARQILYGHTLQLLYNDLIKPHFTYGITIWGNTYMKYIQKLYLLQKRIIRIISFSECCDSTAPLFIKYNIMSIDKLYTYFCSLFIYKCLNHKLPFQIYFKGILVKELISI